MRTQSIKALLLLVTLGIISAFASLPARIWSQESTLATAMGSAPRFELDPFWPKPLPDRWVTGEVAGTCIDANDHLFIVNRVNLTPDELKNSTPAPPVIEFDANGNVVNSWGDLKVLPISPHGCTIDYGGNIWICGNHDGIVQEYSHDGSKMLLQIGTRGHVDSSDGETTGTALNSSHTELNGPSSVAVDPSNGDVYVSDGYFNRRVVVFDSRGKFLRQWGSQATEAQEQAGVGGVFAKVVHCVVIGKDELVYVCDRMGDRIQVFDKMGKYQKSIPISPGTGKATGIGSAWSFVFSPDTAQTFMYVVDGGNESLLTLDRATGQILSHFGRPGHQAGDFSYVHTVAVDSKGNLYLAETINGRRLQKFRRVGD
jgi:DNA-binding beta-propeller fold protein YncE